MRQIKFRGRRIGNGEWIIGYYSEFALCDGQGRCSYIKIDGYSPMKVEPATVGQFTGLRDKNDKAIYEGDVLQMWLEDSVEPDGGRWRRMYVVFTAEKGFVLWGERMTIEDAEPLYEMLKWKQCVIIGNIYNNPELKTE